MYDVVRTRLAAAIMTSAVLAACSEANLPTSVVPHDADLASLTVNKAEFAVAANSVTHEQPWAVATDGSKALVAYTSNATVMAKVIGTDGRGILNPDPYDFVGLSSYDVKAAVITP